MGLNFVIQRNWPIILMITFLGFFYSFIFFNSTSFPHAQELISPIHVETSERSLKVREEAFKNNILNDKQLLHSLTSTAIVAILLGLLANAYLVSRKLRGQPLLGRTLEHSRSLWGLRQVFEVFLFLMVIESIIISLEMGVNQVVDLSWIDKDFFLLGNSLVRDMSATGLVLWLVKSKYHLPVSEIGLTRKDAWLNIGRGLLAYLAMLPILMVLLWLVSFIADSFAYEPPPQAVVQMYLKETRGNMFLAIFSVFVALVGPAIEEIFFRGFAYKAFRTRFGVIWALLLSSLIFALLHNTLVAFVPIFLLGLLLAYLYERTGSLLPSMTLHCLHNSVMVGFTLLFRAHSG